MSNMTQTPEIVVAPHQPAPALADSFALTSTCVECGGRMLWRLGTGEWEHA